MKKMLLKIVCGMFLSSSAFAFCLSDDMKIATVADMADFSSCTDSELTTCKQALISYNEKNVKLVSSSTSNAQIEGAYNARMAKAKATILLVNYEIQERRAQKTQRAATASTTSPSTTSPFRVES